MEVSTRAIKQVELDTIDRNIDFARLSKLLKTKKTNKGRPYKYSNEQMLRLVFLQDKLQIPYDTEMERVLKQNSDYRKFCKLKQVPSHDKITRFKKANVLHLKKLFCDIDTLLDELGYFENDELAIDGTDIPLGKRTQIASYGAKSNKEKFFGIWLITANSTNREIVRDYTTDTGEIGQMKPAIRLLDNLNNTVLDDINNISMDGLFDTKGVRSKIVKLGKTAVIPYNPRKSKIKKAEDLPDNNWRLESTPFLKDRKEFKKRFKKRTASERENSRTKLWTLINKLWEKTTIAWKTSGVYINAQIGISLIATQISALAQWLDRLRNPLPKQLKLIDIAQI